jgi:DNA polymerase-4
VGLRLTVGVARTKFLAKVASGVAKPDGLLVVDPAREREFLHPLPVERLWGVGPVTAERLASRGVLTVGDLARLEEATVRSIVGAAVGRHVHALALLRDPRPVRPGRRRGSVGAQRALGRFAGSRSELDAVLVGLVDRVTGRLRRAARAGSTVVVRVRYGDMSRASRSRTLRHPTTETGVVLAAARSLLESLDATIAERGISLLGLAVGRLSDDSVLQLSLPLQARAPAALDAVVDAVRDRYGREAIGRARLLGRPPGIEVPLLDDPPADDPRADDVPPGGGVR